jgi:hypothetical protein
MRRIPLTLVATAFVCSTLSVAQSAPRSAQASIAKAVPEAAPLPLALDDAFTIEKVFSVLIDPAVTGKSDSPWLKMESDRRYFGAINAFERSLRDGHSYTVHWSAHPAVKKELTVRFEYRQQKLGSHVQTQDVNYQKASGSMRTEFLVLGDEYHQDGQVTAWRVLIIEDGRIVGLQQSFLW